MTDYLIVLDLIEKDAKIHFEPMQVLTYLEESSLIYKEVQQEPQPAKKTKYFIYGYYYIILQGHYKILMVCSYSARTRNHIFKHGMHVQVLGPFLTLRIKEPA